jgi:hypothetical protein
MRTCAPRPTGPGRRPAVLLILGVLGVAPGCRGDPTAPMERDDIIVVMPGDGSSWPDDGWRLEEAVVEGDLIRLHVTHIGGCEDHRFQLLAVRGFTRLQPTGRTGVWSVPLRLAHDDRDDSCEAATVRADRSYGLDPLRAVFLARVGPGPARLWLRVPTWQGSPDSVTVEWRFP